MPHLEVSPSATAFLWRQSSMPHESSEGAHDHDHGLAMKAWWALDVSAPFWPVASAAPSPRQQVRDVRDVATRKRASRASRTGPRARAFEWRRTVTDDADLVFMTVPDDAIAEVAQSLHLYSGQALVHTSGALPASVLAPAIAAGTNAGGFHPLVAFADHDQALSDLSGATVAVGRRRGDLAATRELAESIGAKPVTLPEGGKTAYHAAAMMAAGGLVGLLDAIASVASVAGLDDRTADGRLRPAREAVAGQRRADGDRRRAHRSTSAGRFGTLRGHLDVLREHARTLCRYTSRLREREVAIAVRRASSRLSKKEINVLLDSA